MAVIQCRQPSIATREDCDRQHVPETPSTGKTLGVTRSHPHPPLPREVVLGDGTRLLLRLGTPGDRDELIAGFEHLSPESRHTRFFTPMPTLAPAVLDRLVDIDPDRHVAVAALDLDRPPGGDLDAEGFGVGVGRYFVDAEDPSRAEVAVTVIDEYQGRGIGTVLLDALMAQAAHSGIGTFEALVLSRNEAVLKMLSGLGATLEWDPDDREVLHMVLPVAVG